MVTHITFNAVLAIARADLTLSTADRLACTWEKCGGRLDVLFVLDVAGGARPTCPDCAVHLDAALEMSP